MRTKNVIGIGGVARAGKDTFAAILENILVSKGKTVRKIALADPLKAHCDSFLKEHLNISAFTQIPEEKVLIRPLLVWYGDAQRKRTSGRFWVDLASNTIVNTDFDYYIVTDIRYSFYEKDELCWLKDEWNGKLCHVRRYNKLYDFGANSPVKEYVEPANEHERENDPKIRAGAHYRVEWPDLGKLSADELLHSDQMRAHVERFMLECSIDVD